MVLKAGGNGAGHAAVFAVVNLPLTAAGKAAKVAAVFLQAEIIAVGARGAATEPVVVTSNATLDVVFIYKEFVLVGHLADNIPGFHLHAQELHVVFINAVAKDTMAYLMEQADFTVISFHTPGIKVDGFGGG